MAYEIRFDGILRRPLVDLVETDRQVPETFEARLVPDARDTRPAITLFFAVRDGVTQCREIRIAQSEHGREVRRVDVEDIPVEQLLEDATHHMSRTLWLTEEEGSEDGQIRVVVQVDDSELSEFMSGVRRARRQSRRRGPTNEQLRAALAVYEEAPRAPTEAVAARFGIKHRTASLWIKRARELGNDDGE